MNEYLNSLEIEFKNNSNEKIAIQQKSYLKNHFEFYGIKTTIRRKIQKPFFENKLSAKKNDLEKIVKTLWGKPEREYQY
ncbi:MAG: DNA alkylation repair protein, partial [Bacteroidetes bacterium]|nr:DNA alkylation repair protein [Bacteroidota bacterium]